MTLKKIFAPLAAVALVAVMAVSLVGQVRTAEAATLLTATMTNGTNPPLAGSSVAASTQVAVVTVPAGSALISAATGDYLVTLTFPTGTTFTAGATTAANWAVTETGAGVITATPVSVTASGTALTFRISITTQVDAASTIIFSTAAGGAGVVRFPTSNGTLAVNIAANATPSTSLDSGSSSVTVVGITVSASPASIPGDGLSTSVVTFTPAAAAATAGDTISIQTNGGQFVAATSGGGTALWAAAPTVSTSTPATSLSATTHAANAAAVASTATLRAPSTGAGSATVTVFITPAAGGAAQLLGSTLVTFTAPTTVIPGLPASATVTPTTAVSITSTGTTATIAATFVDSAGNAPIAGGTVTVTTNLGTLTAVAGVTCPAASQVCTGTLPTGGVVSVTLTGGGVAGAGTISFTTNNVTATKAVTVTGALDTLEAKMQTNTAASAVYLDSSTPGSTTFALQSATGVTLLISPKDSAGNVISGVSPSVTVSPSTCASQGTVTASPVSTTIPQARIVLTAGTAAAGTACTATVTTTVGAVTRTVTVPFTIGAAFASTSVLTVEAADTAVAAVQTVKVTAKSSAGVPVADGTVITLVASAGGLVSSTATTVNGVASFTFVAPGSPQTVGLTAVGTSGQTSVTGSKSINVGAAAPAPGPGGSFSGGTIAASGVSIVSFTGTTAQLDAAGAANTPKIVTVTATVGGKMITFVIGAPAFVNAEFNAAFPTGLSGTLVIVKTGA